jgi:hypothetical protein
MIPPPADPVPSTTCQFTRNGCATGGEPQLALDQQADSETVAAAESLPSMLEASGDGRDSCDGAVPISLANGALGQEPPVTAEDAARERDERDRPERVAKRWGIQLLVSHDGEALARLPGPGRRLVLEVQSKRFRWALDRFFRDEDKDLWTTQLKEYQNKFESLAWEGKPRRVDRRASWDENGLWIDLAQEGGRALHLGWGPEGWRWETTDDPPCVFRQTPDQLPLPEPDFAGRREDVLDLLPELPSEEDRLLVPAWMASVFLAHPKPVLLLEGPPGSGKTSAARAIKGLLDPSHPELLGLNGRADWDITFANHAVVGLDNLGPLAKAQEDFLCKVVTGGGISRRKLYQDRQEVVWSLMRPVLITAVATPTRAADLIDRIYRVPLGPLAEGRRRTLADLDRAFQNSRARAVGAVLNALRDALNLLSSVSDTGLGRLADWHHFLRAVAVAWGLGQAAADRAYRTLEARQKLAALHDPLILTLRALARRRGKWEGTYRDLLEALDATAEQEHVQRSRACWPESPVALGQYLKRHGPVLARLGVMLEFLRKRTGRLVALAYSAEHDTTADQD